MHGISECETCGQKYKWRRCNKGKPPRFCSFKCRSWKGLKGRTKNSELSEEANLARIKKNYEKNVVKQEGCWDWKGCVVRGYAILGIRPYLKAHRASWIVHNGPIPKGVLVCHTCDNTKCTNPEHLWLGTYKENTQDKIKKGRSNTPNGSQLKVAKLTEEQVEKIKFMLNDKIQGSEIARMFGVSPKVISRIKHNETWKHVEVING